MINDKNMISFIFDLQYKMDVEWKNLVKILVFHEKQFNEKIVPKNKYGKYCHGLAVLMTPDLVSNLLMKAFQIKLFFIDDVYVGMVGRYAEANFIQLWSKYIVMKDLRKLTKNSDILFVSDAHSVSDIYLVWNTINSSNSEMNSKGFLVSKFCKLQNSCCG